MSRILVTGDLHGELSIARLLNIDYLTKHWFWGHFHKDLNYVMDKETTLYESIKDLE